MKILSGKKLILLGERDVQAMAGLPFTAAGVFGVFGHGVLCLNGSLRTCTVGSTILDAVGNCSGP